MFKALSCPGDLTGVYYNYYEVSTEIGNFTRISISISDFSLSRKKKEEMKRNQANTELVRSKHTIDLQNNLSIVAPPLHLQPFDTLLSITTSLIDHGSERCPTCLGCIFSSPKYP